MNRTGGPKLNVLAGIKSAHVSEYSYNEFVYSVTVKRTELDAKAFNLKFGASDDLTSFWNLKVDFENDCLTLGSNANESIKSVTYDFKDNVNYKINLIVNDGLAKVFVGGSNAASLILDLDGYQGGKIVDEFDESGFVYEGISIARLNTSSGDVYVGGHTVKKVINLTDNNYQLKESEYKVANGVVDVFDSYLNTLETNTEYKFRAVTSLADLNFYIKTKEVGTEIYSVTDKYYHGDDIKIELSEATTVNRVFIDNEQYQFTINEAKDLVTVANSELTNLGSGEHLIKLYTENGRPETKFTIQDSVEIIPEIPAPVSHTFLFIDLGIFAALILGYIAFSQIKKHGK